MDNLTPQLRKREIHNIVIGQKVASTKVQRAKEILSKMTQEEKILWQHLRANRLNGFHFRHGTLWLIGISQLIAIVLQ